MFGKISFVGDIMTKILVECPDLLPSVRLGVLDCLRPFEQRGICSVRFVKTIKIRGKDIKWCDILITVRGCESLTYHIVKKARKHNRLIVYYLDDDLLNETVCLACPRSYYEGVIKKNMTNVIACAKILWGVNPLIGNKYIGYTDKGRWLENKVVMPVSAEKMNRADGKIRILYAGSSSHESNVRSILAPAVEKAAERYGDGVEFVFVGADPGISGMDNVKFYPGFDDYDEYRRFVENGDFSIGLAVVKTEEFFQCKFYNKFLEYTSIGCLGIYTNSKPYTYVVNDKVNGILCDNGQTDWYEAICYAVEHIEECSVMYDRARDYVSEYHNEEFSSKKLESDFPELMSYSAPVIGRFTHIAINPLMFFFCSRVKEIYDYYGFFKGSIMIVKKGFRFIIKKLIGGR